MTAFDWNMSADIYEDMVSCLLSNLNPKTLRIDGSGGDGGRDVQFDTPDGLQIYELKSFAGRMTAGRRTQVQNSLARAAVHDPVGWELIVPINPAPGELKWFDGLRAKYSFPIGSERRGWKHECSSIHRSGGTIAKGRTRKSWNFCENSIRRKPDSKAVCRT